jgi:hypothetical protein
MIDVANQAKQLRYFAEQASKNDQFDAFEQIALMALQGMYEVGQRDTSKECEQALRDILAKHPKQLSIY